ncbi:MAG: hypothetical protein RL196_1363 [Actinomycetota bacterium]|jgi:hypothetical protein
MVDFSRYSKVVASAIAVGILLPSTVFAISPATADGSGATVSGIVQSQLGSNAAQNLVGVNIQLEFTADQTSAMAWAGDVVSTEAGYTFSGLLPGTYRVFIAHGLKNPGRPERFDYAESKFSRDSNGVAYTSNPVYRYFRVGSQTNNISINLLAKTTQEVGTASGNLRNTDGGALFDDQAGLIPATIEFLNTSGKVIDSVQSDSNGSFSILLTVGDYYARVGCKEDSQVQCQYYGDSATIEGADVISILANSDANTIDITSITLKQFTVTDPSTSYSKTYVYLGETVKALSDPAFVEAADVTYQWYMLNIYQEAFGEQGTLIPGATSDSFTVTEAFDAGIQGAVIQTARVYAEVTYSLDGYVTTKSTFSGRNLLNPFQNYGARSNGYAKPKILTPAKVVISTKPKAKAKLIYPVLTELEIGFDYRAANWYVCTSKAFKVDLENGQITGGGCKVVAQKYQLAGDTVALPNGYKGKYLVSVFVMMNSYDRWVGSTKPIKLK